MFKFREYQRKLGILDDVVIGHCPSPRFNEVIRTVNNSCLNSVSHKIDDKAR